MRKFPKGVQAIANKQIDLDTDTLKCVLLDVTQSDTAVKQITGATNATPIVVTSASHGFSNGDLVWQRGILGNLAGNGLFKVANVATNTYELQRLDGTNVVGSAAYTSGGSVVNLSLASFLADIDACRVGTDQALTAVTINAPTPGILDAADPSWPTTDFASLKTFHAFALYHDTGNAATSELVFFGCGQQVVTVAADASAAATTLWVEALAGAIPNGTIIALSNGVLATLTAGASAGARSLTVAALSGSVAAGNHGVCATTGSGFPWTIQNAPFTLQWDNGAARICAI